MTNAGVCFTSERFAARVPARVGLMISRQPYRAFVEVACKLFPNALRPSSFTLITILGVNIGALVGGALIVEQFFHLNGIGSFIIQSAFSRDYAVVMTLTALVAIVVVVVNFLVDLLYIALDPRIRRQRALV